MAQRKPPAPRRPKELSISEMKSAVTSLKRRIADLDQFDLQAVHHRADSSVEALRTKVNGTLQDIFGPESSQYSDYSVSSFDTLPWILGGRDFTTEQIQNGYAKGFDAAKKKFLALIELLDERIEDAQVETSSAAVAIAKPAGRFVRGVETGRVFIVHGSDAGTKETVARFLGKLKLEPIVLHEQANAGRTIIEKFEDHADVAFAIVICTPDDVGYPAGREAEAKPRARQNVVFELGFFVFALGRQRVCVLHSGGLELPSDYQGVVYVPIDAAGAWRYAVAKEMQVAGLPVDLNDV